MTLTYTLLSWSHVYDCLRSDEPGESAHSWNPSIQESRKEGQEFKEVKLLIGTSKQNRSQGSSPSPRCPSSPVKPLAPDNLTLHTNVSDEWLLTWNNLYPSNNLLYKDLISMVNISREDNPAEVSGRHGSLPLPGHRLGRMLRLWSRVLGRGYSELESSLSARLCPRHVRPLPGPEFAVCSCVGQCSVA